MRNLAILLLIAVLAFGCKDDSISKADLVGVWTMTSSQCLGNPGSELTITETTMMNDFGINIAYELVGNEIHNISPFASINPVATINKLTNTELEMYSHSADCTITATR